MSKQITEKAVLNSHFSHDHVCRKEWNRRDENERRKVSILFDLCLGFYLDHSP